MSEQDIINEIKASEQRIINKIDEIDVGGVVVDEEGRSHPFRKYSDKEVTIQDPQTVADIMDNTFELFQDIIAKSGGRYCPELKQFVLPDKAQNLDPDSNAYLAGAKVKGTCKFNQINGYCSAPIAPAGACFQVTTLEEAPE